MVPEQEIKLAKKRSRNFFSRKKCLFSNWIYVKKKQCYWMGSVNFSKEKKFLSQEKKSSDFHQGKPRINFLVVFLDDFDKIKFFDFFFKERKNKRGKKKLENFHFICQEIFSNILGKNFFLENLFEKIFGKIKSGKRGIFCKKKFENLPNLQNKKRNEKVFFRGFLVAPKDSSSSPNKIQFFLNFLKPLKNFSKRIFSQEIFYNVYFGSFFAGPKSKIFKKASILCQENKEREK